MQKLHLNVVTQVVNEKGEEFIERATNRKPKNIGGLTREWFEEQNLTPPEELNDDIEVYEDGSVILDDEHINYEALMATIPLENIDSWIESAEIGSMIYMKSGMFYHVYETVEELDDYVNYLSLSSFEKWWIGFKIAFSNFFRRKQKITEEIQIN